MAKFNSIDRAAAINPKSAFPLDARTYFETLSEAETAAASAKEVGSDESVYYFGQIIQVVNPTTQEAKAYQISKDSTTNKGKLKALGGVENGDGKIQLVYDDSLNALKFIFN